MTEHIFYGVVYRTPAGDYGIYFPDLAIYLENNPKIQQETFSSPEFAKVDGSAYLQRIVGKIDIIPARRNGWFRALQIAKVWCRRAGMPLDSLVDVYPFAAYV